MRMVQQAILNKILSLIRAPSHTQPNNREETNCHLLQLWKLQTGLKGLSYSHVSIWTILCFRSSHLSLNITISIILNCLYIFTKSFIYECKHLFLFEVISSPGISLNHPLALRMLTLCPLGKFSCFLSSADFFQNQLFRKILSGIPSECQTDWIQTVCKSHQQMTLGD